MQSMCSRAPCPWQNLCMLWYLLAEILLVDLVKFFSASFLYSVAIIYPDSKVSAQLFSQSRQLFAVLDTTPPVFALYQFSPSIEELPKLFKPQTTGRWTNQVLVDLKDKIDKQERQLFCIKFYPNNCKISTPNQGKRASTAWFCTIYPGLQEPIEGSWFLLTVIITVLWILLLPVCLKNLSIYWFVD